MQNWNFGGVPNGPTTGFAGTPFLNFNHTYDITDSIARCTTLTRSRRGIYLHKSLKDQTAFTSVNGNINFARDTNNPNDANWAFANALLGNYDTLAAIQPGAERPVPLLERGMVCAGQLARHQKLTLEYGIRFYWVQPQYDAALQTSSFNPALYDPAAEAVLRTAALDANGNRVSVNPLTGEIGPAALIGSIVNNGKGFINGVYANGMGLAGKNGYPEGLDGRPRHSVRAAPGHRVPVRSEDRNARRRRRLLRPPAGQPGVRHAAEPAVHHHSAVLLRQPGVDSTCFRGHVLPRRRGWASTRPATSRRRTTGT